MFDGFEAEVHDEVLVDLRATEYSRLRSLEHAEPVASDAAVEDHLAVDIAVATGSTAIEAHDDATLGQALIDAEPGDVIVLAAGTYREPVRIAGETGEAPVTIVGPRGAVLAATLTIEGGAVAIHGLTVAGAGGVVVEHGDARLVGVEISGSETAGVTAAAEAEVSLVSSWIHDLEQGAAPLVGVAPAADAGNVIGDPEGVALHLDQDGRATALLAARDQPHSLLEVAAIVPEVAAVAADAIWVEGTVLVQPGGALNVSSVTVPAVRMLSPAWAPTSIAAFDAELAWSGGPQARLAVSSWDPETGAPDTDMSDGRAFVLMERGTMTADAVDFSELGFEEGSVSGVAWRGSATDGGDDQTPAYGHAIDTTFVSNYFGAYTFVAKDMVWRGNEFRSNYAYGFDPHDFSDGFLVENNAFIANGKHGLIFSRGCSDNVIRDNRSVDNLGNGFMIDDGRVDPDDPDSRYHAPLGSGGNLLQGNIAQRNRDGIVLEGGSSNRVADNEVTDSWRYGIIVKDGATGTVVSGNTIEASERAAIFISADADDNEVERNTVVGADVGVIFDDVTGNDVVDNEFTALDRVAVQWRGSSTGNTFSDNILAGHGTSLSDATQAVDEVQTDVAGANRADGWYFPPPLGVRGAAIAVWAAVLVPALLLVLVPARIRRPRRPAHA